MALSRRVVGPDLVHHYDRGSQYGSCDYTDLLKENGIAVRCRARVIRGIRITLHTANPNTLLRRPLCGLLRAEG